MWRNECPARALIGRLLTSCEWSSCIMSILVGCGGRERREGEYVGGDKSWGVDVHVR